MKRLATIISFSLMTFTLASCGSNNVVQPLSLQNTTQFNSSITANYAKVETKLSKAKFGNNGLSKIVETINPDKYKGVDDTFIEKSPGSPTPSNGVFDRIIRSYPFKSFESFEYYFSNKYKYDYNEINNGLQAASTKMEIHYTKNISFYRKFQNKYKASTYDMKRFIALDIIVNTILPVAKQIHIPPYKENYKLKPSRACYIMPTFYEISKFNRTNKTVSYVKWDNEKAKSYYQLNYPRYMGIIMELAPKKSDTYELIHKEISKFAGL